MSEPPEDDPERHLKRLHDVVGVSTRIQELALRRRLSPPIITKEEKFQEVVAKAKDARSGRLSQLGPKQNYLIDIASTCFKVPAETITECVIDCQQTVNLFVEFFEAVGLQVILMQHQLDVAPTLESGRFKMDVKNQKMMKTLFSTGKGKSIKGKSLMVYRLQKEREVERNFSEVCLIFSD